MNHPPKRLTREKIYVKVNAGFDSTGYMRPISIVWTDGRIFQIDKIKDYRPADSISGATVSPHSGSDCYTVVIKGQERHLYFERADAAFRSLVGRWFVENLC